MDARVEQMIRGLLGRQASAEDKACIARLVANLPADVLASPAMVADIVLRMEHLREMREGTRQATWDAQQKIHQDLPHRIDQAAAAALSKMRDQLPIDAADRVGRLLKAGAMWTAVVIAVAASAGWMGHGYTSGRQHAQQQAAAERAFNRCIDAVEGVAVTSGNPAVGVRYDGAVYRTQARTCAAEFADRRAGG